MAASIAVFGAGAVGTFFGGLLARAGLDVRFIARGDQLQAMRLHGLTIESTTLGTILIPQVRVFARAADAGATDVVLVCVKAHQTPQILEDLQALRHAHTVLVTLQNGVESDAVLAARFGPAHVVPAVVYVGATVDRPGQVSHVAAGTLALGVPDGADRARLDAVRDLLASGGTPVRIADDIARERWRKLLWNAAFNSVSAATLQDSAVLLRVPETRAVLVAIMREVVAVARAQEIDLRDGDVDDQIAWTERAAGIRTSTAVDRARGREMEIDALIGVISRQGRQHGVATPVADTMVGLLRALEGR